METYKQTIQETLQAFNKRKKLGKKLIRAAIVLLFITAVLVITVLATSFLIIEIAAGISFSAMAFCFVCGEILQTSNPPILKDARKKIKKEIQKEKEIKVN